MLRDPQIINILKYNPTLDTVFLSNYAYPSGNAPSTPGQYEYWNDFDAGAIYYQMMFM